MLGSEGLQQKLTRLYGHSYSTTLRDRPKAAHGVSYCRYMLIVMHCDLSYGLELTGLGEEPKQVTRVPLVAWLREISLAGRLPSSEQQKS